MSMNFYAQLGYEDWLERQDQDWVASKSEDELREIYFNASDELVESMIDDEANY